MSCIRVVHEVIRVGVIQEVGCRVILLCHVIGGRDDRQNDDWDEEQAT